MNGHNDIVKEQLMKSRGLCVQFPYHCVEMAVFSLRAAVPILGTRDLVQAVTRLCRTEAVALVNLGFFISQAEESITISAPQGCVEDYKIHYISAMSGM